MQKARCPPYRAVSLHLLEILALPLFNESLHAVQKFFHIRSTGLALYTVVAFVKT